MRPFPHLAILLAAVCATPLSAAERSPPQPIDLAGWFTAQDYPVEARIRRDEGRVGFRLDVDAGGRVSRCRVVDSSGDAILDHATCALATERGRFAPARDRQGRAVAGRYDKVVDWRLPPPSVRPLTSFAQVGHVDFDASGVRAGCRVEPVGQVPAGVPDPCSDGPEPFTPQRAGFGAVAGEYWTSARMEVAGEPVAGMPALPVGARPVILRREAFTVAGDGRVSDCTVVAERDQRRDRSFCYLIRGTFQPAADGGERRGTFTLASYFVPRR